jgi:Mg-chelatase subunit ChlD
MNTEIIMIVDRSRSMETIRAEAEGGINKFIKEQQEALGDARLTLVQFDHVDETVVQARGIANVQKYVLRPRGNTALYDAIGRTLNEQGKRIAHEKWADLVVLVITTDGDENASCEYSAGQVNAMIEHAQKHGWQVLFLAANQDAFATGAVLGVSAQNTATYGANSIGTRSAYAAASANTLALRAGVGGQSLQAAYETEEAKRGLLRVALP